MIKKVISNFGSGSLPGLMLDLGLLKIIWGELFFLFIVPAEGSNPAGPISIPFLTPWGKANPYLTQPALNKHQF